MNVQLALANSWRYLPSCALVSCDMMSLSFVQKMLWSQQIERDEHVDNLSIKKIRPKHHTGQKERSTFLFIKYEMCFDYKLTPHIFPQFFLVVLASNTTWPQLQVPKHWCQSLANNTAVLSFEMLIFSPPNQRKHFGQTYLGHIIWKPSLRNAWGNSWSLSVTSFSWLFMARVDYKIWKSLS